VDNFFDYYAGGLIGMRGYPYYGLGGNKVATLNVSYRFPISDNLDFRVLQVYFDKLYFSAFGDFGNAWTDSPMSLKDFKRDAGFEVRLETYSFYAYPTRIFFSAAYGFDEFSRDVNRVRVSYGNEWRLYFGVLFGFDIGDTE
jgi:outer membrane protein assembly factor BamA